MTSIFDPIFVHASMRSGSTYFFNVLRRNELLMCFNEAIMDGKKDEVRIARVRRKKSIGLKKKKWVNHHFLEKDDSDEFIEAWEEAMHLCPEFPEFEGYLPPRGVLSADLVVYLAALMTYARSRSRRPVFCEVNSRGRAGALRVAFGGFHIAQYRDPLSQFGSFVRALIDAGVWAFLAYPVVELGTNATHPLYSLVPEEWRPPHPSWRTGDRSQYWASNMEYFATVASPKSETVEKAFRWHLFSWFLTNLAAISYSDSTLDIDKVHDDAKYRASVVNDLAAHQGVSLDFGDLKKFERYYEFECFDMQAVCAEVTATISKSLENGRLEKAIRALSIQSPAIPTAAAADLLFTKIDDSIASMAISTDRHHISVRDWKIITGKHWRPWFNPTVRRFAEHVYPIGAPIMHAARRIGLLT
jgi:hypothetical protein